MTFFEPGLLERVAKLALASYRPPLLRPALALLCATLGLLGVAALLLTASLLLGVGLLRVGVGLAARLTAGLGSHRGHGEECRRRQSGDEDRWRL